MILCFPSQALEWVLTIKKYKSHDNHFKMVDDLRIGKTL